ncbi:P-loop containing nucleoside triphosphate hydrolase protein, partial [Nadsonia fulvescens var. elongata DSM 6958]
MSDDEFQFNLTEEDLRCISVEETKRRASNGQAPRLTQTTLTSSFFNGGGPLTTRQTLGYITKPKKSKDAGISDDSALSHPTHHALNEEELDTYIYPTNLPIRDYQYNIVQRALFSNLLCALPTGLGKTFIASTVMLNWYRWTKTAKIIFMAPTKPLVSQQIEACLGITGMPSHDSSVLIGGALTPKKREDEWNNKRIFFAT